MPRLIDMTIPEPTPLLNVWQRLHWAQRRKVGERWARLVAMAAAGQIPAEPFQRARVLVQRHSSGRPDMDGLVGGLKPLLDALVRRSSKHPFGLGIIEDDDPGHLVELVARSGKGKRGEGFTRVVIVELPDADGGEAAADPLEELGDEEAAA